jgi:hypothetical protein
MRCTRARSKLSNIARAAVFGQGMGDSGTVLRHARGARGARPFFFFKERVRASRVHPGPFRIRSTMFRVEHTGGMSLGNPILENGNNIR